MRTASCNGIPIATCEVVKVVSCVQNELTSLRAGRKIVMMYKWDVARALREAGVPLRGARAVVVGRSVLVGQPMALMLQQADATVTVAHSHSRDLEALTREAEVLVVAAEIGRAHV